MERELIISTLDDIIENRDLRSETPIELLRDHEKGVSDTEGLE
jgi:hypothetical protein